MAQRLAALSEAAIRQRASDRSWQRGQSYFRNRNVLRIVWRDGVLTAQVGGSHYEPYVVRVFFHGDEITNAYCTCPYDWGGYCKHIIAALLYLVHRRDEVEIRPPLAELLAPLGREQLVDLLLDLAADDYRMADIIEQRLAAFGPGRPSEEGPDDVVNIDLIWRQVQVELRGAFQTGYDGWGGDLWYDSDLGVALEPAVEQARTYLDAGSPHKALRVLEIAFEAWNTAIEDMEEYVRASFEDVADEFTYELGITWTEALLVAELSADERDYWQGVLEEFTGNAFGGSGLEIALAAVQQGWDYPPLVAAMEGQISELGAWDGPPPPFADDLAQIRLRILEQQGRYDAYLNLAQAEGQFLLYLQMLVRTGRHDEALSEALEHLSRPDAVLALSKSRLEHGEVEGAFRLARHGLALPVRGKGDLAEWLRDRAHERGQADLALWAARRALEERTSLGNYLAFQRLAGDSWPGLKPEALGIVRGGSREAQVDIYLHEKMYPEAIEAVERLGWFRYTEKVIEAVKEDFPDWAFAQYRRQAEGIMDAAQSKYYGEAVDWLRRGRDILLAAGKKGEWEEYLAHLMKKHWRKYKLMPMLRALG